MGVREAWTWSRIDGVRIWVVEAATEGAFEPSDRSRVLPGLGRRDLDRLLASRTPRDASRRVGGIARRVAAALIAAGRAEQNDRA